MEAYFQFYIAAEIDYKVIVIDLASPADTVRMWQSYAPLGD